MENAFSQPDTMQVYAFIHCVVNWNTKKQRMEWIHAIHYGKCSQ